MKRIIYKICFDILTLSLIFSCAPRAQEEVEFYTGSISGTLRTAKTGGVVDAVAVSAIIGLERTEVKTDENGRFRMDKISIGDTFVFLECIDNASELVTTQIPVNVKKDAHNTIKDPVYFYDCKDLNDGDIALIMNWDQTVQDVNLDLEVSWDGNVGSQGSNPFQVDLSQAASNISPETIRIATEQKRVFKIYVSDQTNSNLQEGSQKIGEKSASLIIFQRIGNTVKIVGNYIDRNCTNKYWYIVKIDNTETPAKIEEKNHCIGSKSGSP